jgi:hypothetical protein
MKSDPFVGDMNGRAEDLEPLFENADRVHAGKIAKLPRCVKHPDQPLYPAGYSSGQGGCNTCISIRETIVRERRAERSRKRNQR